MRVVCFQGEKKCDTVEELNEVLKLRSEKNSNDFYLIPEETKNEPFLEILVKDEWTYVIHFKEGDDPGRYAYVDDNGLDPDGEIVFNIGSMNNIMEMSNQYIISLEKAYEVAREYFITNELSKEVKWFEL